MIYTLILTLTAATLTVSTGWAKPTTSPSWEVSNPRVYLPSPGAKATAGYFELKNTSHDKITVELTEMKPFKHVETHETVKENEQAKMIKVDRFEVAPTSTLELAPGGKHLMLFEPQKPLKAGQKIKGSLKINGQTSIVEFNVIEREKKATTEEHHHHH